MDGSRNKEDTRFHDIKICESWHVVVTNIEETGVPWNLILILLFMLNDVFTEDMEVVVWICCRGVHSCEDTNVLNLEAE